jgi:hypothetical protein
MNIIKFQEFDGPVYVGRSRGTSFRKKFNLNAIDLYNDTVIVIFPESTYTVSSSFFMALFEDSVIKYGSKDLFHKYYKFQAVPYLLHVFDSYLNRILSRENE